MVAAVTITSTRTEKQEIMQKMLSMCRQIRQMISKDQMKGQEIVTLAVKQVIIVGSVPTKYTRKGQLQIRVNL